MIRSYAELEEFLANGGRLRFDRHASEGWSDADTGRAVVKAVATRALAEGKLEPVDAPDGEFIYAGKAA